MQTLDVLALDGWLLDYFTGVALGYEMRVSLSEVAYRAGGEDFTPTDTPADLMPVLERMATLLHMRQGRWDVRVKGCTEFGKGPTVAVAVCRALVIAKLGKTVQHPAPAVVGTSCEDLFA